MKKTFFLFLCLLALTFFAETTFAATPIPGISVVVKRNPGRSTLNVRPTDDAGKMSTQLESGKYEVSLDYNKIIETVTRIDENRAANKGCYKIQLTTGFSDQQGALASGTRTIEITNSTGTIPLVVPEKGTTIRFTLTWDSCK